MTTTTDHLAAALDALKPALSPVKVLMRGDKLSPNLKRVLVVDHIVSTPLGDYEGKGDQIVVQVGCYAESYEDALALDETAQAAMDGANFIRQNGPRPAPRAEGDTLHGVSTDYAR